MPPQNVPAGTGGPFGLVGVGAAGADEVVGAGGAVARTGDDMEIFALDAGYGVFVFLESALEFLW